MIKLAVLYQYLDLEAAISSKIDALKLPKIEGNLKLILKNIGINSDDLFKEYLGNNHKNQKKPKINIIHFKDFFKNILIERVDHLKEKKEILEKELKKDRKNIRKIKSGLRKELQETKEILNAFIENETSLKIEIEELRTPGFTETLRELCVIVGLDVEPLLFEAMDMGCIGEENIDPALFQNLLREKLNQHVLQLKETATNIEKKLQQLSPKNETDYVSMGIPPDHVIFLPYQSDTSRGLSAEAMLEKMRKLTDPKAPGFNLHTKNCSKTTIDILTAGAEHDPALKSALSQKALGFFGTPQQVVANVQKAANFIANDTKYPFNFNVLERAMGRLIGTIMNPESSRVKKVLAGVAMLPIVLLKTPLTLVKTLLQPSQAIKNIVAGVDVITRNANSTMLKGLAFLGSGVALLILSPFGLAQQIVKGATLALKTLVTSFTSFAKWLAKKTPRKDLQDEITSPLPGVVPNVTNDLPNSSYCSMALLHNSKIASNIKKNTVELVPRKNPVDILCSFEDELEEYPDKVITLSTEDFTTVHKYVTSQNNKELTARFQKCCNESLARANILSSKAPEHITEQAPGSEISSGACFFK